MRPQRISYPWILRLTLDEVYRWCLKNRLTPHPGKSEVMLISKGTTWGPLAPARLGDSILNWATCTTTRLLGMTVDDRLTWAQHTLELKKSFAKKRDQIKQSRFLPHSVLEDFYFKVILPSVKYGLILWGSCTNSDLLCSIEKLHCRAARIIFNLPKDMPSFTVIQQHHWSTIEFFYKIEVVVISIIK